MKRRCYRRKEYNLTSKKVKDTLTFILLADLHGKCYGDNNENLIQDIEAEKADCIFVVGDMVCAKKDSRRWGYSNASDMLEKLSRQTNVCYAFGNHESKMKANRARFGETFDAYEEELVKTGVCFLRDCSTDLKLKGTPVRVSGIELEREYYKKFKFKKMPDDYVAKKIGDDFEGYHILLAHNPHFGNNYFSSDADLILSGHNHGGVVAFPGCGGVITPQFRLFDRYTAGKFDNKNKTLIISRGLGDHIKLPRIFNPKEYVVIKVHPDKET